jgi:hypothetical protein
MATKPKPRTPSPPRPGGSICRIKLDSIVDIRAELSRIYRTAKSRRMDWHDATRACHVLNTLARLIEGSGFERRLAELEAALEQQQAERQQRQRPNGHHPPPS